MKHLILSTALLSFGTASHADVKVTFNEGAPKDRFTFQNIGDCPLPAATVVLDLTGSAGKLVFDVTGTGAGVEVFQPFELVSGKDSVTQSSAVKDGDKTLSLTLSGLAQGDSVAFTIDVDDTLGARESTVNTEEISGAMATVQFGATMTTATFDGTTAVIKTPCES